MASGAGLGRIDGRRRDQIRPVKVTRNFTKHAEGSVLIEMGDMRETNRTYEANLQTIKQTREMISQTIALLKASQ